MSEYRWPEYPLGPERDAETRYMALGEMRLEDLEKAIESQPDTGDQKQLQELLERYRPQLAGGGTVAEVLSPDDAHSWQDPVYTTPLPGPRQRRGAHS